ncbi:MAG: C69 family dipeptidase, partial [Alphaproteobacteria bacterium]
MRRARPLSASHRAAQGRLAPRRPPALGCDSIVALGAASATGATLFGKNSDRPPDESQPLQIVPAAVHPPGSSVACQWMQIPQARETARVLGSRPHWLWGFEHGVNEHGVAIGNETVFARVAPAARGLVGMDLVRLGLERATTAAGAVEVVTALIEEHGQGGSGFRDVDFPYNSSFLVADPREAWILETAGRHWAARGGCEVESLAN